MAINWTENALKSAFQASLSSTTPISLDHERRDSMKGPEAITQQFKKAMRRLTGTVSIIATQEKAARFGMVVTTVSAVCTDPPAILVCVNRSAKMYYPLIHTRRFTVNLLEERQYKLIAPFSGKLGHDERFAHGTWSEVNCLPVLGGAQATLLCRVDGELSYGSHDIVIGHVDAVMVAEPVSPLLWQDGRPAASRVLHE